MAIVTAKEWKKMKRQARMKRFFVRLDDYFFVFLKVILVPLFLLQLLFTGYAIYIFLK